MSSASPTVSVVIPTYNRRLLLQEALNSVFQQTLTSFEVIVIDDGSTDDTIPYLQNHYGARLRLFTQKNSGPAAARNYGVSQSRGKYIAFLDSDDSWLPRKLEVQVSFLEKHPEFRFCQSEEIWIRHGLRVNPRNKHAKPSGDIFLSCLKLCLISPSSVLLEKLFFEQLGGFDASYEVCEDYELWLRATLLSPFQTLPEALVVKRGGHEDQLSRRHWGMDRFRVRALEKLLASIPLTSLQREAVVFELKNKLSVLAQGFSKRYPREKNPYQEKLAWYEKPNFTVPMGEVPIDCEISV